MENKITETKNKLKEMRELVNKELKHIPRGNMAQNLLRMYYQPSRMHSLGKKAKNNKTKEEVLLESIKAVKKEFPEYTPQYDTEFFKVDI
jgi:hypothetical protein